MVKHHSPEFTAVRTHEVNLQQQRREAFFGLIAPVGVDLNAVTASLREALSVVSYQTNEVRFTDLIRELNKVPNFKNEVERYEKYIAAGDEICAQSKRRDVFALYGIAHLHKDINRKVSDPVVHIFRQIKRTEEIRALNDVYGRNILFIGCYSPREERLRYLMRNLLKTERGSARKSLESKALAIMATDEDERENPNGQRLLDCFPHSHYVLDCSSADTLRKSCERLVRIFFGHPFEAPTMDEYGAYAANAASYRSLDLSRQVGAAIFGPQCEIISMGCNEVPKAGGGTYWSDGLSDGRDHALGFDSNQRVKEDMARDALERLRKDGWLTKQIATLPLDKIVDRAFADDETQTGPLSKAMMADVIEYGRMVHAEMNALSDAARFRRSTAGATLYCTTMPCHMCTKLIVASGISRVVYIQPYGKSLVEELFHDSVSIDQCSLTHVIFDTLKGVTPNGYKLAFQKVEKRKDQRGIAKKWESSQACPVFLSTFPYYSSPEALAINDLEACISKVSSNRKRARRIN